MRYGIRCLSVYYRKFFGIVIWTVVFQAVVTGCAGMGEMNQMLLPQTEFKEKLNALYFDNASEGWIAGNNGVILHTRNGGATWTSQVSGVTQNLRDIVFADANTGWVVGDNGTILRTVNAGLGWVRQTSGTSNRLNSVFFRKTDTSLGWAVGDNGTILHTTNGGLVWVSLSSLGNSHLNDVFFRDSSNGWIVGNDGLILRTTTGTTGALWIVQVSGTGRNLHAVQWFGSTGWVIGDDGIILRTASNLSAIGYTWVRAPQTVSAGLLTDLFLVSSIVSPPAGWISGKTGLILQTTDGGTLWIPRSTRTDATLRGLYFVNDKTGWAVGDRGTILHTVDGGIFWIRQFKR